MRVALGVWMVLYASVGIFGIMYEEMWQRDVQAQRSLIEVQSLWPVQCAVMDGTVAAAVMDGTVAEAIMDGWHHG